MKRETLMTKNSPRIVSHETVRMIELGHPWIIADSFTKKWRNIKNGEIASLVDSSGKFLATAIVEPNERIVARVVDRKPVTLNHSWLVSRIKAAVALRRNQLKIGGDTTAYRLINAEGDFLPGITVDSYGNYLMLQLYAQSWRPHIGLLTNALEELLKPVGIYEKNRPQKTRELEAVSEHKNYGRLLVGKPAPQKLEVLENGLKFCVTLEQDLNSGLFLDQRENRLDLMRRANGKRVLNLFSYTGAFSVAAAAAGAQRVTSVDASARYTEWAKNNFHLNRFNPQQHEFSVADCMTVLAGMAKSRTEFDIILMDPPSFSTTSKSRFTTRGGTSDFVAAALPLLKDGGVLITSSNHQKIDLADYLKELRRGALQGGCQLQVIAMGSQGGDFPYPVTFPEGRYLKYVVSVKQS